MSLPATSTDLTPSGRAVLWKRAAQLLSGHPHPLDTKGSVVSRRILVVYLVGFFLMPQPWLQLAWLVMGLALAYPKIDWQDLWDSLWRDGVAQVGALFLGWMTVRSFASLRTFSLPVLGQAGAWLAGTVWLVVFGVLVWQAAVNLRPLEAAGGFIGGAAALATVVSMVVYYYLMPWHQVGERLANWFVYDGLNPVCTGLTFGFAALWLTCLKTRRSWKASYVLLTIVQLIVLTGVLFTRSRGALLALAAGYGALTAVRGWRQCRWDWLLMVAVVVAFQISSPLITVLRNVQAQARMDPATESAPAHVARFNPMKELVDRADSGRLEIYRGGIKALPDASAWIFGIGQWGTDARWNTSLDPPAPHLHSALLATLVHGGLIGVALLLALLALGFRRAWRLAKAGHPLWWALLAYGCAGLIFDGQTFTRMNTLPLFEPLLVFFPLTVAASVWAHRSGLPRAAAGEVVSRSAIVNVA